MAFSGLLFSRCVLRSSNLPRCLLALPVRYAIVFFSSPVSTLGFASSAPAANRQAGLRRVSGESAGRGYRDRPSGMIGGKGWPLRELRAVGNIGDLATKPVIGADFWR